MEQRGQEFRRSDWSGQTPESSLEDSDVEVDQQSRREATNLQVRQHLRQMNGLKMVHGFDLDDDTAAYDQVHPIAAVRQDALVFDRQRYLPQKCEAAEPQLSTQTLLVREFEQPGTE